MKITFYFLMLLLGLAACKSKERVVSSQAYPALTSKVEVEMQDSIIMTVQREPVKAEVVKQTHGTDMMSYCIVVGSFINEQNAVNLRNSLLVKGFPHCGIMRNREGMYRVGVVCFDDEMQAQAKLYQIKSMYPQFADAWILKTGN